MTDIGELTAFLKKANAYGYGSGGGRGAQSRLGAVDLEYKDGVWVFHDTYFGGPQFVGTEVIYRLDAPVWGMSYSGHAPEAESSPEEVFAFLRRVLLMDSGDLIPVRGPARAIDGGFMYKNHIDGNMESFYGTEHIFLNGALAHICRFSGGLVR